MKQIILLAVILLNIITSANAQITNPKLSAASIRKVDTTRLQTLKTGAENMIIKPVEQLPDLRLTGLSFAFVKTQIINGIEQHTFQINYTVRNDGTLSLNAGEISLQGWITYSGSNPRTTAGCGSVINVQGSTAIGPGASFSGFYRCTAAFDKSNPPLYKVNVDSDNLVKELNDNNNGAQATLLF